MRHKQHLFKRIAERLRRVWNSVAPGPRAWRGAAWGTLVALVAILLQTAYSLFAPAGLVRFAIGTLLLLSVCAFIGGLATLTEPEQGSSRWTMSVFGIEV